LFSALVLGACGPANTVPNIPMRTVPDPLKRSSADITNDSLVIDAWQTRAEVPDPLAEDEGGQRVRIEATLYGEDVIAAVIAHECRADSAAGDSCAARARATYDAEHRPDSLFRIRLDLRSTFSVNSLQPKFWDIYVRDEQQIAHEAVRMDLHDPVVVREDTIPEPGRAAVRGGLYRRSIDLYFPLRSPFGVQTIGPGVKTVHLIISRERKEQADLVWEVGREGVKPTATRGRPRRGGGSLDF